MEDHSQTYRIHSYDDIFLAWLGIMSLNFTIPNRPVIESPCSYYQYMWSTCRYVELPCQCTPADTLCENLSHGASYEVSFPSENNSTYHVGCLEHTQPILRHIVTWSNVTDVIVFQDTNRMIVHPGVRLYHYLCPTGDGPIFLPPHEAYHVLILDCPQLSDITMALGLGSSVTTMTPLMSLVLLHPNDHLLTAPLPDFVETTVAITSHAILVKTYSHPIWACSMSGRMSEITVPSQFTHFGGRALRIGTLLYPPFVTSSSAYGISVSGYGGYLMEILELLVKRLNLRPLMKDYMGRWGHTDDNGSWTGAIRGLMDLEVDMLAAAHTITAEREQVIDFTYLVWEQTSSGLLLTQSLDQFYIIKPLHVQVWLTFGLAAVITAGFITGFENLGRSLVTFSRASLNHLRESLWYTYGAACNQAGHVLPRSLGGRLVVAGLWFNVLVIVATYCSNLTAYLAVTKATLPFSTLQEVVDSPDYRIRINTCQVYATLFQANNGSAYPGVWERSISDPTATWCGMALEDVVMEMFEGNKRDVIIAAQSVLLDKAVHSGYCNWGFLDENIVKTGVAFALPHGSPYKTYVDALIVALHEAGVLEKLKLRYFGMTKSDVCDPDLLAKSSTLAMKDVWPAFAMMSAGAFLASITLILELLRNKEQQHIRKRNV